MKTTGNKKPAAAANKIWKKAAALPRRIWAVGGAVALAVVIVWLMLAPAEKEAPPVPSASGVAQTQEGAPGSPPGAATAIPDTIMPREQHAFIQTVRMHPARPTRMDSLKAEVETTPAAPKKPVYTYLWKVNDRVIQEAVGDTLNLSAFHQRDLVTVTVTPYDGETAGFAVASPVVAIHSVPPSLELKAMRRARKTGEPIELQLAGAAPDGDRITFSLEDPRVPGMTIDPRSGKISWRLQPEQKGVFRFGAAVEDDNGTKVTKVFEITAE